MKMILTSLAAVFVLSSCFPSGPGLPGSPGMPIPGVATKKQEDEAFRQGYGFGRRDRRLGRVSNFMLYNNYYNSTTKNAFARGYMTGYKHALP